MGLAFLIVAGSIMGWLTAFILQIRTSRWLQINVVVGVIGALIAGLIISPLVGEGDLVHGYYSVDALLITVVGSALALICVNLLRHREVR